MFYPFLVLFIFGWFVIPYAKEYLKEIIAFGRLADPYKIVVVLNFSNNRREIQVTADFLSGSYKELFSNVNVEFGDSKDFDLEPWAYRVFVVLIYKGTPRTHHR